MIRNRMTTKGILRGFIGVGVCLAGASLIGTVRPAIADAPPGRYTIAAGEVTDTQTGLVWQQESGVAPWAGAASYCSTLALNNHAWRLPSVRELQTLVDDSKTPAIDLTAFPGTATVFITSNAFTGNPDNVWTVDFTYGFTFGWGVLTDGDGPVRCVR